MPFRGYCDHQRVSNVRSERERDNTTADSESQPEATSDRYHTSPSLTSTQPPIKTNYKYRNNKIK